MPELPDITVYVEALEQRVVGAPLVRLRLGNPFLLRTVDPPVRELEGKQVLAVERMGKRIVLGLEGDIFVVLHLMRAGRLRWHARGERERDKPLPIPGKIGLAAFDFQGGTMILTEAGSKRRASLHIVRGVDAARALHAGGIEVDSLEPMAVALRRENHTLKRSLTDPRILSGIGNAFSDEILHAARLSPVRLTGQLTDEEMQRLHRATLDTLGSWTARLRDEFQIAAGGWPDKVTAFREGMAVHGRYGQPCPVCSTPVQRIVYAESETNYCPTCQTGGKLLADRSLSRLLRSDWPKTVDDLETSRAAREPVPIPAPRPRRPARRSP